MTWKPLHVRYSVRDAVPRPHAPHRPGAHASSSLNYPPYAQHATLAFLAAHATSFASTRTATPSAVLSLRAPWNPRRDLLRLQRAPYLFFIADAALPSRANRASVALPPRAHKQPLLIACATLIAPRAAPQSPAVHHPPLEANCWEFYVVHCWYAMSMARIARPPRGLHGSLRSKSRPPGEDRKLAVGDCTTCNLNSRVRFDSGRASA
ncbi:hypothetical protein K438DRAFT_1957525 [Mycena galopus ATCC 62051]|nr:hypothetical protein K438DRAFT_1957525 [Mycena galopus ATCC 62051]